MWLIFLNKEQDVDETEEEEKGNATNFRNIYVLDKCVFKV
jgi:hypothetical protein